VGRWAKVGAVLMGAAAAAATAANGASTAAVDRGRWTQFRGGPALTGRSSLQGGIRQPAIVWKQFIGARETYLVVCPSKRGRSSLRLPTADLRAGEYGRLADRLSGTGYDLDRSGSPIRSVASSTSRIVGVLPGGGYQLIEAESAFSKPGNNPLAVVRLKRREKGEWVPAWESEPIPMLYQPNPITGDFDGDGKVEVAVTPWYDLWILDGATGKLKQKCRFMPAGSESGRAYGWVGAFDLDGDGRQEFVVLGDFENFISVLGWREGKLVRLWSRLIEKGITRKETIFRPGANPVQDADGDGHPEIAVCAFNAEGDHRWHTQVIESLTGRVKLDLPDEYLSGIADVDEDGASELFLTQARTPLVPARARLRVVALRAGVAETRLTVQGAAFETADLPDYPKNVNSGAGTGRRTLLVAESSAPTGGAIFTRRVLDARSGEVELTAWEAKGTALTQMGRLAGPRLAAIGLLPTEGVVVRAAVPGLGQGRVMGAGFDIDPSVSRRIGAPLSPPVVGLLARSGPPVVVAQGAEGVTSAFTVGGGSPRLRWQRPVRGMYTGSGNMAGGVAWGGVVLADLEGKGDLLTLAGTSSPGGCARMVALDGAGRERWRHDFPRFPGAAPEWNIGGLTLWSAGHFRDRGRCDVLVSLRRSTMHSDETFLLDGRTGTEVWHRTEGVHIGKMVRGCGGAWVAAFDQNGDGLDDAGLLYPDGVFVMDGPTGRPLLDLDTNKVLFPDVWSFYAAPAAYDFTGQGRSQLLYSGNGYKQALLSAEGKVLWQEPAFGGGTSVLPGIGDLDGDRKVDLVCPGFPPAEGEQGQRVRCLDAATGRLRWMLGLPGAAFGPLGEFGSPAPLAPSTADLDGDGRDECLIPVGDTLYCVGAASDGRSGEVRWKLAFPATIGPAAIADVEGNGEAQVVVVCADGCVYGVADRSATGALGLSRVRTIGPSARVRMRRD
jgi:outer membrane protein assembly factor BamB